MIKQKIFLSFGRIRGMGIVGMGRSGGGGGRTSEQKSFVIITAYFDIILHIKSTCVKMFWI